MRLILTRDVAGLGGPGDVVTVADGYGRNYLVPQRFAIVATAGAEKQIVGIRRAREIREIRDRTEATQVAAQLADLSVRLRVRAGESGRLFGSVTAGDVIEAVRAAGGPVLDKRRVELPDHIKSLGSYPVTVRLHPEITASVTLDVVPLT
ncbi:MAG: 50S ribosomal protein L9 [Mycobacteriales bacterium]